MQKGKSCLWKPGNPAIVGDQFEENHWEGVARHQIHHQYIGHIQQVRVEKGGYI
jgi:hypothetical protein